MKEFRITSPADALQLSCLMAEPVQGMTPKGIVQILHGMCEHKERYIPFMEFLSSNGYVCIIHDHRGHGATAASKDDLGYMGRGGWNLMIEDAKAVTDYVRGLYPKLRLHLLGHSMGSLMARCYIKRYDDAVHSLILTGCPSDNPAKGAGKLIASIFAVCGGCRCRPNLLHRLSFGTYNKPFENEGYINAWVCSDPQILKSYHDDPLCMFIFTSDGFRNLLCLMQDCYSRRGWVLKNPCLPVHFFSGAEDPCRISDSALKSAVEFMKKVGYADADLKLYPGMRHEILNETDKLTVWNDVLHTLA